VFLEAPVCLHGTLVTMLKVLVSDDAFFTYASLCGTETWVTPR
jgi:hypothetical protein